MHEVSVMSSIIENVHQALESAIKYEKVEEVNWSLVSSPTWARTSWSSHLRY